MGELAADLPVQVAMTELMENETTQDSEAACNINVIEIQAVRAKAMSKDDLPAVPTAMRPLVVASVEPSQCSKGGAEPCDRRFSDPEDVSDEPVPTEEAHVSYMREEDEELHAEVRPKQFRWCAGVSFCEEPMQCHCNSI